MQTQGQETLNQYRTSPRTTPYVGHPQRRFRVALRRRWKLQIGCAYQKRASGGDSRGGRNKTRLRMPKQSTDGKPRTSERRQQNNDSNAEFTAPYWLPSNEGIGSYALKQQYAKGNGRSLDPSQVNDLHPLSERSRRSQSQFYTEDWARDALGVHPSGVDESKPPTGNTAKPEPTKEAEDFWDQDDVIDWDLDEDSQAKHDPWGMNKELKNSLKAGKDRGVQIPDVPLSKTPGVSGFQRGSKERPQKDLASIQTKDSRSRILDGLKKDAVSQDFSAGRDAPPSNRDFAPVSSEQDYPEEMLGQGFQSQTDPLMSAWENDMGWNESEARQEMEEGSEEGYDSADEDEKPHQAPQAQIDPKGWFSPDSQTQERALSHQSASTSQPSVSSSRKGQSNTFPGRQTKRPDPSLGPELGNMQRVSNEEVKSRAKKEKQRTQVRDELSLPPDLLSSSNKMSQSLNPRQFNRLGPRSDSRGSKARQTTSAEQSVKSKSTESFDEVSLLQRLAKRSAKNGLTVNDEGKNFYKAADALAARLLLAVEGEKKGAEAALFRRYRKKTAAQLRASGVILTDLKGQNYDSQHYGEYNWVFRLAKDAACEGAVFDEPSEMANPKIETRLPIEEAPNSSASTPPTQAGLPVLLGVDPRASESSPGATVPKGPQEQSAESVMVGSPVVSGDTSAAPQGEKTSAPESRPVDEIPPETNSTAEVLSQKTGVAESAAESAAPPPLVSKEPIAVQELAEEDQQEEARPLPNHRFAKGDPILLLQTWANGEIPELEEDYQSLRAQIVYAGKTFIRVTCRRDVHEQLLLAGPERHWRMDKSVQETTAERQIQAIAMLDKPYAFLEEQESLQLRKTAINPNRDDAQQQLDVLLHEEDSQKEEQEMMKETGLISKQFRVGELRVRQILLGDPKSPEAAKAAPTWASVDAWKKEAKKLLQAVAFGDEATRLNKSQIHAIAKSLSSTLTLWQGPPGTGKTRTLLALIEILSKLSSVKTQSGSTTGPVLACADTNAATDNIVQGLMERNVNVVRIGQQSSVREGLLEVTLIAKAQKHRFGKMALERKEQADEAFKESRRGGGVDKKKDPEGWEQKRRGFMIQAQRLEKESRTLMDAAQQEVLKNVEVVASTCAGAGDYKVLQNMRFRMVVIDEATQSTEPSTLIPLLRGAESVVMAGDPKQLPPTVISETALKCNMDLTLFERLMATGVDPWLLDTQYRMHPAIASFPNDLFYDGDLKSGVKAVDRPAPSGFPWPNPACPVALVECDYGREQRPGVMKGGKLQVRDTFEPGSSSYCNVEEARMAIRAYEMLMESDNVSSGAILSPYNGQVRLIRSLLREQNKKYIVSSVDGYQGREADFIVFSSVRNNPLGKLGFVTDVRRLNVAITRPRQGLVVVGAPDTLASDRQWRQWMVWVRDRGGLLAPEALRPSQEDLEAGCFDPKLEEYFALAPAAPGENDWFSGAENYEESADQWDAGPSDQWSSRLDADADDEQILAAWENAEW